MKFYKYSGSGNDFIIIDNFEQQVEIDSKQAMKWCSRREGIGADGVVIISPSTDHDFKFRIYNSDGSEPSMCGNASRCCIHYIYHNKNTAKKNYSFETVNGVYFGEVVDDSQVKIKMTELYDLDKISIDDLSSKNAMYLNTGVPHAVVQVNALDEVNVNNLGKTIRNQARFGEPGTNVDFFEVLDPSEQRIRLRVYERGVEAETLCCGTGIMASAIVCSQKLGWTGEIFVETPGGKLVAIVDKELNNLFFQGSVEHIYTGELS